MMKQIPADVSLGSPLLTVAISSTKALPFRAVRGHVVYAPGRPDRHTLLRYPHPIRGLVNCGQVDGSGPCISTSR
eukprot:4247679-Prymnesium_polylepis.1